MSAARRKILGIGYPKFAIDEWKVLADKYDIHHFTPEGRDQVMGNIKRLCEEHGPFDAAYVLFNTSRFSPFHEDLLSPLFSKGPQCGLFAQAGVGFDDVDHKWLAKNGCYLSNTPTAVTEATGDMAVMLILNTIRGTYETEKEVREGRWKDKIIPTDDPEGKTVGIIGLGAIGKVAARKLKPWDMKLIYHNRKRLPEIEEKELGATWVPFDQLISTSDVISLNCPLNDATRGLISKAQIEKMKDGVYIVNTARGGVIDQDALIEALESGKVARAGLDVFTPEPLRESWLFSSPKVSVQPHLAAFTRRTFLKGEREVFANVKQYMETGTPVNPCNNPAGK